MNNIRPYSSRKEKKIVKILIIQSYYEKNIRTGLPSRRLKLVQDGARAQCWGGKMQKEGTGEVK